MTFCFFSAQYLPTVGGVERYTHNLGKCLVKKGHRVVVVTSALPGLPGQETADGIEIFRLPVFPVMGGRFPVLKCNAAYRRAKRMLNALPMDFIVVQTRFYTNSLLGARMAKRRGIPAIVIEHGTAHLMRGGLAGVLGNVYEHWMMRKIRRCCDCFYGVSTACCKWLAHFGVQTDKVLYNAVDPAALAATAAQCGDAFLAPYLAQSPVRSAPVIAFAGRFIPEKGVLPLLEAFRTVQGQYPSARLLLAGDGPQLAAAREVLPEGAQLLGMLPYAQNLALLARADIFCLPTFSEGFSTSVLEAAALRAAILTTPTGGSPELVENESYGLLFPDMRAESIAAALCRALADPAWCQTAQQNAYDKLLRCFTWERVSDALIEIAKAAVR